MLKLRIETFIDRYSAALIALALMMLLVPMMAFAQEAEPGPDPLGLIKQLVIVVIPVVTGLVLAFFKRAVAAIPNQYLPIIAPIVGMLVQAIGAAIGVDLTPGLQGTEAAVASGALGMTAVGAHQTHAAIRTAKETDALAAENERLRAQLAKRT